MTARVLSSGRVPLGGPILTGLSVWLDSAFVTLTSGNVSSYLDQSGHGNDATQGTPANQPAYIASALNGRPAVRGNGSSSKMSFSGVTFGAQATITMVATASTGTNDYLWSTAQNDGFITQFSGRAFEWIMGSDRATFSVGATGPHILTLTQVDGGNYTLYLDGALVTSAHSVSNLSGRSMNRLFDSSSGGGNAAADIDEFLVYPTRALLPPELTFNQAYLHEKWNL